MTIYHQRARSVGKTYETMLGLVGEEVASAVMFLASTTAAEPGALMRIVTQIYARGDVSAEDCQRLLAQFDDPLSRSKLVTFRTPEADRSAEKFGEVLISLAEEFGQSSESRGSR